MGTQTTGPGGRSTPQRAAIASLLADLSDFCSAQDIHAQLRDRGESVGLATVYRALGLMADSGAVDVLMRGDGETLYRRCSTQHHHHLVCRTCGRTVEVAGPAVEAWAESVAAEHGFTAIDHTLELSGLCSECAAPH